VLAFQFRLRVPTSATGRGEHFATNSFRCNMETTATYTGRISTLKTTNFQASFASRSVASCGACPFSCLRLGCPLTSVLATHAGHACPRPCGAIDGHNAWIDASRFLEPNTILTVTSPARYLSSWPPLVSPSIAFSSPQFHIRRCILVGLWKVVPRTIRDGPVCSLIYQTRAVASVS